MLHVSTWWQSTAQHSDPLNHALLLSTLLSPLIPSLQFPFSFLTLLHLTQLSNPLSPFSSSSSFKAFVLLCCSDTFLKHAEEREKGKTEGERMERMRGKKGGKVSAKVRQECRSFFISLLWRTGWGEWVSKERAGRSKANRKWQRWRGWETAEEWRRQM